MAIRKLIRSLMRFSAREMDSAWQYLYALPFLTNQPVRARMFQRIIEEVNHAELLRKLAETHSDNLVSIPAAEHLALFRPKSNEDKALGAFYAAVYARESAIRGRFGTYAKAAPFSDVRQIFQRLEEDEHEYAIQAQEEFRKSLPGGTFRGLWQLKSAARKFYEAWCRLGLLIGEVVSTALLSAVYYIFGGLVRQGHGRQHGQR